MADIQVKPKRSLPAWAWVVIVLAVVALAAAVVFIARDAAPVGAALPIV